ncbi:DUF4293 domain-containing protein [Parabacteroides sp. FAFU027]|uniref:DUF4293 domain-containing protein n=1 Tax=Parabacteroides sp. FAFU027 TaxID=2922715 RepID=UPI001FAEC418|nr:DUF4293 domain-containing protein [Parabacteroides sp. FAFU027]
MIQRIQSVYLLAVAILMGTTSFTTLAQLTGNGVAYTFSSCGIYANNTQALSTLPVFLISLTTTLLAVISILLYKKRSTQIKITVLNSILIIGFYIAFLAYYFVAKGKLNAELSINIPLYLPLASFILNLLALRGIRKDEALIKSLNRIR